MNRDQQIFELAREFLETVPNVTSEMIDRHLNTSFHDKPQSMPSIYGRLLESAQNAQMSVNVIGGVIGGVEKLRPILFDFDVHQIVDHWGDDSQSLLDHIVAHFGLHNIRRTSRSLWPRFSMTILDGAEFLSQFENASDFYDWIDFFDKDNRSRPALPILLNHEIHGFGFALACDFVKELGFMNFSKPDVHIRDIFIALGLCHDDSDYFLFKAVSRIAEATGRTPYAVDKLFWLIGSGYFYYDEVRVGRRKTEFITYAQNLLSDE